MIYFLKNIWYKVVIIFVYNNIIKLIESNLVKKIVIQRFSYKAFFKNEYLFSKYSKFIW